MRPVIPVWVLFCLATCVSSAQLDYRDGSLAEERPQSIYSEDSSDPWNQIFFALYTKAFDIRISDTFGVFANSEAYEKVSLLLSSQRISRQVYRRIEGGDRAIDPLYPSFAQDDGVVGVLTEPRYSLLTTALQAALDEKMQRGNLQRALMQSDLWAAHDVLEERRYFRRPEAEQLLERRSRVLSLVARLVKKLALTVEEIKGLPRNYDASRPSASLPALFDEGAGWIEIQGGLDRIHETATDNRRAARIFIRPLSQPADRSSFLEHLRSSRNPATQLDAVALAIQSLLIDQAGEVVPSPLISSLQLRSFERGTRAEMVGTVVEQFDLSRQRLLQDPASDGFIRYDAKAPAYVPAEGKDYSFASWVWQSEVDGEKLPPILVPLRSRCQSCHATDLTRLVSFSMPQPMETPVLTLDPARSQRAEIVAARKQKAENFLTLRSRWEQ